VSSKYKSDAASSTAARSVYSGREREGHIRQIDSKVAAYDRLGRELGRFDDQAAAIAAISAKAEAVS
jgi:hypothetical protein